MKCTGNCATCEVAPESKAACCAVQTLKNVIELKSILSDMRAALHAMVNSFDSLKDVAETIDIPEPTDLGAEDNKEVLNN